MPGRGRGRGRRDSESDAGTEEQPTVGTFETLRDEGEHFVHVKQYQRAIESFTKALDMRAGDKTCLVARAKCYLQMGNSQAALADSESALQNEEEGKGKDIRALCTKAEALYQKGDFENALMYYHRGHKLRPELQEFRLGIQKSQEAINNSIGTPESVKLETSGDLSFFYKQDEKQKQQQKGYSKPSQVQKREEKKERSKPQNGGTSRTTKQLLGELYRDRAYLEKLCDSMTATDDPDDTERYIKYRSIDGLEYLDGRCDFWRQQKPMYARERDHQQQHQKRSAGSSRGEDQDRMKYILQRLEEIDEAQANGKYDESLKKSQKTLNKIQHWGEDSVKNKPALEANLYSCMGNAYLEMGKFKEALEYHNKDLALGQEEGIDEAESRALDNLGRTKARMGKYEDAIVIWEKKLPKSKAALESTWLYHEIGRCHLELGQNSDAKDFGEKSLAAAKEADDRGWQLHATVLIAQAEVKCNELQAAADSFERAKEMAEELKDTSAQAAIKKALEEVNSRIVQGVQDEDKEQPEGEDKEDGRKSPGSAGKGKGDKKHGKKLGHRDDDEEDKHDKEEHKKDKRENKKEDKDHGKKGKKKDDDDDDDQDKSEDEEDGKKEHRKGVKTDGKDDDKKHNEHDKQEAEDHKTKTSPDKKSQDAKDILLVGSSFIARLSRFMAANKRAWTLPIPIRLIGRPGLQIHHLRPLLDSEIGDVPPAYLVLHLGANDIGRLDLRAWIGEVAVAILYIRARWPQTCLLWSDMLPRSDWRHGNSIRGAENARKRNQRRARSLIFQEGGAVIRHPRIEANPQFLLSDGVHLTEHGQAVFQRDLETGMLDSIGGEGEKEEDKEQEKS